MFQEEESELHNPDDHDCYNRLRASNLDERHATLHLSALKHQERGHGAKSQKPQALCSSELRSVILRF
uniref:Uncharacterized protein n=1 Tax=Amphimedon queenslandica TaxID=400682 RepID=A0A1X7T601_AMPQE